MKWTENGIQFEGTAEEYLAIHNRPMPLLTKRGKQTTVIDLDGQHHTFKRIADAAHYIEQYGKHMSMGMLAKILREQKTDTVSLVDILPTNVELNLPTTNQETA